MLLLKLFASGLESSDEEEGQPKQANGSAQKGSRGTKGRLKRPRQGEDNVEPPEGPVRMADIFGDSDEEEPAAQNGAPDDEEPAKQKRKVDLFGSSDEE